ncbi:MAG: exodeoxyribonuclease VII small subunit [Pirellulaceae bacterium]
MAAKKRSPSNEGDKPPKVSFEQSLEQLEAVVRDLEEGGLGLNEALASYEQGVRHLRRCYRALQHAERKIELLSGVDAEGNPLTEPLDPARDEEEETTVDHNAPAPARRRAGPRRPADARKTPPQDDMDGPPTLF